MVTILVTGCDGQLGRELRRLSEGVGDDFRWIFTEVGDMDITDRRAVEAFFGRENPAAVVNCAAFTDVEGAERSPEAAFAVNRDGPGVLARASAASGAALIHVSTDFVFDGRSGVPYSEEDATAPLSVYGQSKLEGEEAVAASECRGAVIRTSWLYSPWGRNFVKSILAAARKGGPLRVVADQSGSPTAADGLAGAIIGMLPALIASDRPAAIYHYCDTGVVSRAGFASEIVRRAGLDCAVEPASSDSYPSAAVRPAFSALATAKITADFGIVPRSWQDALTQNMDMIIKNI